MAQRDVERLRRRARQLAVLAGMDRAASEQVAMTVSELATNLVRYAHGGRMAVTQIAEGILVECSDNGPGIADLDLAMRDGTSTGGGMGSGLPSARRMMDTFTIESGPGGTHIVAQKWAKRASR